MPTPKQVRYHYGKITDLWQKLADALTAAHNAGVIEYNTEKFHEESPCSTHFKTDIRIDATTEKALARAMRTEITRSRK